MKRRFITVAAVIVSAFGLSFCAEANKTSEKENVEVEFTEAAPINNEGKDLLENKCMVCHKIQDKQDAMLAPPFAHIKSKYSKVKKSEQAFLDAFVSFTINPKQEDAMMFGALKQFTVMPNLNFEKEDIKKIANYIYNNDFPEPKWCN